jgi:nucleotide-binding universal stress UspA family protein
MYRKILVAFDGSDGSNRAFAAALDLAAHNGHEVCLVSVIEDLPRYAEESLGDVDEALEHARRHFEALLDAAEGKAKALGVRVVRHVLAGHPVETIVELAERENADLIVIGGLGHSHILRRVSGGTGSQITYHAHCSVLVIR